MIRIFTLASVALISFSFQSCRNTTEIVEIQPVVIKKTTTRKPAPKPAPKPRTPTPAETTVVNQYD